MTDFQKLPEWQAVIDEAEHYGRVVNGRGFDAENKRLIQRHVKAALTALCTAVYAAGRDEGARRGVAARYDFDERLKEER